MSLSGSASPRATEPNTSRRTPLRARAWALWQDISDFDDSCRYERLLIDLDGIHGGDFPASYPTLGTRPELLAHLEDEVDRMIELGGDGLSLELLLASALGW